MIKAKGLLFIFPLIFSHLAFGAVCPDPNEVTGSLSNFNLQKNDLATLVDEDQESPQARAEGLPQDEQDDLELDVEPLCYSSDYPMQRGCQRQDLKRMTFTHVILNKLRANRAVAFCYYVTPGGTQTSVTVPAESVGGYGVAKPKGGAWDYSNPSVYICRSSSVHSCPFEFVSGRAPSPFSIFGSY